MRSPASRPAAALAALACTALVLFAPPVLAADEPVHASLARAEKLLADWRYDEAIALAERLLEEHPDLPAVRYLAGKAKFHQQDYAGAVALLEDALAGEPPGEAEDRWLRFARETGEITKDYVVHRGKRFEIRVPAGSDEVLAPYALEALDAAWQHIGDDFGWHPDTPIVVEAYATAEELSAASGLPVEAIKNSGTIAICKHNKLMFTSPKALLRGYEWLDTLAHEYVHYVISRVSHNTVPIWLHEGLAKYEESRWNGEAGRALSPWAERLLANAVAGKRELITFEQMHPSMALLPTQEDTALAFAEVFTAIEYLVKDKGGYPAVRTLIAALKAGKDDDTALREAIGRSKAQFEAEWRAWLKRRPMQADEAASPETLTFKEDAKGKVVDSAEDEADAASDVENPVAQRHAHLGELLRMRGRNKAAAVQYEKAYAAVGPASPLLASKLGLTYMALERYDRAEAVLEAAAQSNPSFVTSHVHLGRLRLLKGDKALAEESFLRANEINPFDPEIHASLHAIYKERGESGLAEREARAYGLLTGAIRSNGAAEVEEPGWLTLRSTPWARVTINGHDAGLTTPLFRHPLEEGEHEVVLDRPGHEPRTVKVQIARGKEKTVTVRLE